MLKVIFHCRTFTKHQNPSAYQTHQAIHENTYPFHFQGEPQCLKTYAINLMGLKRLTFSHVFCKHNWTMDLIHTSCLWPTPKHIIFVFLSIYHLFLFRNWTSTFATWRVCWCSASWTSTCVDHHRMLNNLFSVSIDSDRVPLPHSFCHNIETSDR